jgi:hypothetical protein
MFGVQANMFRRIEAERVGLSTSSTWHALHLSLVPLLEGSNVGFAGKPIVSGWLIVDACCRPGFEMAPTDQGHAIRSLLDIKTVIVKPVHDRGWLREWLHDVEYFDVNKVR